MRQWVISISLLAAGFFWGAISSGVQASDHDSLYRKLEVLAEVLSEIESHYVDSLPPDRLVYGAAYGATEQLDEHSEFFSPEDFEALRNTTDGEYAGVGIELSESPKGLIVSTVQPDSPAARAGVVQGDELISIDRKSMVGVSVSAAQRRLRGPVGTRLVLEILRANRETPWNFTLVRGWIRLTPIVTEQLEHGIRYARVESFSSRVAADLETALRRQHPARGLVLDLRGNPGGLFDEAVAVCDLFIERGQLVTVIGRAGRNTETHHAHAERTLPDFPMAVLIDSGSASAAEIVAGCLKDLNRARLFGSRTYGKGSVQSIRTLSDGSGLKLTVARYLTPSGARIDGRGVKPNVVTSDDDPKAPLQAATRWLRSCQSTRKLSKDGAPACPLGDQPDRE